MKKTFNKLLPRLYGAYFNILSLFSKKKTAEKAFNLFCTVRKGRVLPQQSDYLEKAKYSIEDTLGHQLQTYHWPGNKETVLLVHGWESNSFRWRNLIAKLRNSDYNVFAFDAPAHGHSSGKMLYVPLYADCLQHMIKTFNPIHLIGHSVGGMTILYNQSKHSHSEVEKIVTIGSPSEFHEILEHYQKLLGFNTRVLKAFENYIFERFGFQVRDFSSSKFVENNTKKGLLLHDELDILAPFHASEKVHARWKGSQFIRTRGLGHSMHQDYLNEQIIDFLKS
ncbi:alpha/beta hydrolase [Ulvibacterium sp.]|uniref:alpha/beta hydrolase n=1 Tax=Ulvibacterium sp. TaxID=2665914 RepID=UPI002628C2B4|nr:alpha/beta hydrolase [Ulvibacterium sp.]